MALVCAMGVISPCPVSSISRKALYEHGISIEPRSPDAGEHAVCYPAGPVREAVTALARRSAVNFLFRLYINSTCFMEKELLVN